MAKPLVKSGSSGHWYLPDGQPRHDATLREARKEILYPSVTSIDKDAFVNQFLDNWKRDQILLAAGDNPRQPHENVEQYSQRIYDLSMEKSRTALEFGKAIHDCVERFPNTPSDPALTPWYLKFEAWYGSSISSTVAVEETLLDHDLGVAGRTDLLGKLLSDGKRCVVDYKTQDVKISKSGKKTPAYYDSWKRQLAFYAVADAKECGTFPDIPVCISLIIDSNEGGEVYPKTWETKDILQAYRQFIHGAWLWFDGRGYWPIGEWSVCNIPQPR